MLEQLVVTLLTNQGVMMGAISDLTAELQTAKSQLADAQNDLTALNAKATETVETLGGLVARILALENSSDQEAELMALVDDAKALNATLGTFRANVQDTTTTISTAEDNADDHLPPAPPPTEEPPAA